jgi:hypothetical protein
MPPKLVGKYIDKIMEMVYKYIMCIKYKTLFSNEYFTEDSEVTFYDENYCGYVSPLILQDIIIEADGLEVLTINCKKYFDHKNLSKFDYEKYEKQDFYLIKNYKLKTFIPINIFAKKCGDESKTELTIELINENNKNYQKLKIFDKEVIIKENNYTNAFEKIYNDIKDKYIIKICVYCKKSNWNPYGGNDFVNQVCFKNIFEEFNKIETKDKNNVGHLMAINNNFKNVLLTEWCKEYKEK